MSQTDKSEQAGTMDQAERRSAPRTKVSFTAKIIYNDGATVLDCAIQDLSKTGASIVLTKHWELPSHIFLLDMTNRIAYYAEIVSVRTPVFGVKILETHPLAKIDDPELRFLKRIWISLAH